jgi:hypothetical protein
MPTEIKPKFHTTTQLGDLARNIHIDGPNLWDAVLALRAAVLELEAYAEQQVAEIIAEAARRWPEDWTERLHDGLVDDGEEETVIDRQSFLATPGPLARPPCYAGTCDKPGHYHMGAEDYATRVIQPLATAAIARAVTKQQGEWPA